MSVLYDIEISKIIIFLSEEIRCCVQFKIKEFHSQADECCMYDVHVRKMIKLNGTD